MLDKRPNFEKPKLKKVKESEEQDFKLLDKINIFELSNKNKF